MLTAGRMNLSQNFIDQVYCSFYDATLRSHYYADPNRAAFRWARDYRLSFSEGLLLTYLWDLLILHRCDIACFYTGLSNRGSPETLIKRYGIVPDQYMYLSDYLLQAAFKIGADFPECKIQVFDEDWEFIIFRRVAA